MKKRGDVFMKHFCHPRPCKDCQIKALTDSNVNLRGQLFDERLSNQRLRDEMDWLNSKLKTLERMAR